MQQSEYQTSNRISALLPRGPGHQFVIYGDACSGVPGLLHEQTFGAVNAAVRRLAPAPEFIAFLGDEIVGLTADPDQLRMQWKYWLEHEMAWLDRRTIPLWHTTGNHTAYDPMSEAVFREVLGHLPRNGPPGQEGLSYWVRRGDLLLVFVHTLWTGLGGEGHVELVFTFGGFGLGSRATSMAEAMEHRARGRRPRGYEIPRRLPQCLGNLPPRRRSSQRLKSSGRVLCRCTASPHAAVQFVANRFCSAPRSGHHAEYPFKKVPEQFQERRHASVVFSPRVTNERRPNMRKLSYALAALATIAVAAPTVASAEGFGVTIGSDRDYYRDRDDFRGPRAEFYEHDRGWHRGWYNHDGDRTVIIKRHHHWDD